MRLPEAVAGALAVPLLYDLVRRPFGRVAGLGAAAALAVTPISVLTSHSDTMDSLMMALDVAAAWLVVVGAQRRSTWLLVAAGAVLGLAFNVKLFEALFVLPALAVLARVALAACALAAVLAVPTASAVTVARAHRSDAGLVVQLPGLAALSAFLKAHQGHTRYEVASTSVFKATPLIVRDGRPVLMLTADQRPLLTPAQLERLVRGGELRYLLIGGGSSPAVRWARAHAHRVHVPGVPDGTLYRLSA